MTPTVMRERTSQLQWLLLGAIGILILLCAGIAAFTLLPRAPRPIVTFKGFVIDAEGRRQAEFTICNVGQGTLRRWDFYETRLQDGSPSTEHQLGPDKMLHPGDFETLKIDLPSTSVPWNCTFHFSDYNVVEENACSSSLPFVGRLSSGEVDLRTESEWITSPN
jgi:hypothetical protein